MDDMVTLVDNRFELCASPTEEDAPVGFEGSDDDVRARFEQYLYGLLASCHSSRKSIEGGDRGKGAFDIRWRSPFYFSNSSFLLAAEKGAANEFGQRFVEAWMQTVGSAS
jgi:hypothetical protein